MVSVGRQHDCPDGKLPRASVKELLELINDSARSEDIKSVKN